MAGFATYEEFNYLFNSTSGKKRTAWIRELTQEQLKTKNEKGTSVAHTLAEYGCLPGEFLTAEVLELADIWGETVACSLACRGSLPPEWMTRKILWIADGDGRTVAHVLAANGYLPRELMTADILSLRKNNGWTVAHSLAEHGYFPRELMIPEMLGIADKDGETAAHVLAGKRLLPREIMTSKILFLENNQERTVLDRIIEDIFNEPGTLWRITQGVRDESRVDFYKKRWEYLYPELLEMQKTRDGESTSILSQVVARMMYLSEEAFSEALDYIPEDSLQIIYVYCSKRPEYTVVKEKIDERYDFKTKNAEAKALENILCNEEYEDIPDFYSEEGRGD